MATDFKQKVCPRCKRNHDRAEGLLCSFCIADEAIRKSKIQPTPENYLVECLIAREGDTQANIGNIRYTFKHNDAGHSVCDVVNPGHYNQFLKMLHYRAYRPEEIEEEETVAEESFIDEIVTGDPEGVEADEAQEPEQEQEQEQEQAAVEGEQVNEAAAIELPAGLSVAEIITTLAGKGYTDSAIAEYLGDGISRQRVTKIRQGVIQ